jgi:hypothetical protein
MSRKYNRLEVGYVDLLKRKIHFSNPIFKKEIRNVSGSKETSNVLDSKNIDLKSSNTENTDLNGIIETKIINMLKKSKGPDVMFELEKIIPYNLASLIYRKYIKISSQPHSYDSIGKYYNHLINKWVKNEVK